MQLFNRRHLRVFPAIIVSLVFITTAYGQDMQVGQSEVTGQVGIVAGIGTHASFGGSVGTVVTDRIFVLGEFSYIPLGSSNLSGEDFEVDASSKALNFNVGGQYQFPRSGKAAPYAGLGLGFLRSSGNFTSSVGGVVVEREFSNTDFYVNLGGGFRYYVNDRWGFKPELMLFAGSETYVRIAAGVFYQFGQ